MLDRNADDRGGRAVLSDLNFGAIIGIGGILTPKRHQRLPPLSFVLHNFGTAEDDDAFVESRILVADNVVTGNDTQANLIAGCDGIDLMPLFAECRYRQSCQSTKLMGTE